MAGHTISFGAFRLISAQRLLLEGDKPVRLGSRAFDILAALVERAGEVVGKDELIARAWPRTFIEESNLKFQISALRRALGDGQGGRRYVVTVPGRGYNFVAPVRIEEASRLPLPPTIPPAETHNLPLAATRMIGRDDAVAAVVSRLSRERFVTIVGPGGIGKTTVALAVAERIVTGYDHGVWLVDLAPLGDPRLVSSAVATVLGLEIRTEDPIAELIASLRDKRILLLLDSCEHVIDAVASFAAAVLTSAPGVKILATSREPLGVAGEHSYRLGPLSSPQPSSRLTAAEAAAAPAVQLFVERITAIVDDFALTDANAPLVVEICRRLDGLPLAIELVAPRAEVLGVAGLAAGLNKSLPLLGAGRRTTMPRHRTMRAVVDWSYGLLTEDERFFFRALGVFAGGFTVEAATAVVMNPANQRLIAIDRLADLVAKSLVVADVGGTESRFRLLDTTRAYVIEKLDESGERQRIARRHAEHYRTLFERAEGEVTARPTGEWMASYAGEIDNLRAALDWTFSPGGDLSIGVTLTAAAVPLWMRLNLLKECRSRARQALGALGAGAIREPRAEMRLHAALGASMWVGPEIDPTFTKVLEIAEDLGDREYQLRALQGLYFYHTWNSRYRSALPFAQKFHDLAMNGSDPTDRLCGERTMGLAKHFLGDQIGARRHLEQVLTHYVATDRGQDVIRLENDIRFGTNLRVATRAFLSRVLWIQGFSDQAMRLAEASIAEAQATGRDLQVCHALVMGASIALWVGNLGVAARYARSLLEYSGKHSLPLLHAYGARFCQVIALRGGDLAMGSRLSPTGADELLEIAESSSSFRFLTGPSDLVEGLGQAGRLAEALALVETEIEQSERSWIMPELLRLKGDLLLLQKSPAGAEMAEDLFRQALDQARQQGALSWELRAATSLARLLYRQGRSADAVACLQPVYDRFTEGFETADLIAAKRLLDEVGDTGRS
jgi:predicted ATPase/DNA-binding winged helix-turn-helix (wHTH) protein